MKPYSISGTYLDQLLRFKGTFKNVDEVRLVQEPSQAVKTRRLHKLGVNHNSSPSFACRVLPGYVCSDENVAI